MGLGSIQREEKRIVQYRYNRSNPNRYVTEYYTTLHYATYPSI
jgi:hypothetical protein